MMRIRRCVGLGDLPALLTEIAMTHPHASDMFGDALRTARVRRATELTATMNEFFDGVKPLVEYVEEQYVAAPYHDDGRERELWTTAGTSRGSFAS